MMAQLANASDQTKDPTQPCPADRRMADLGTITITKAAADGKTADRTLLLLPNRLPEGIEVSGRPADHGTRADLSHLLRPPRPVKHPQKRTQGECHGRTRVGAIGRVTAFFDEGGFQSRLSGLVAVPSTSQDPGHDADLSRLPRCAY